MKPLVTLSSADHADVCPGSAVLYRVREASHVADLGSAPHAYVQVLVHSGREVADSAAPAIAERWGLDAEEAERFAVRMARWAPQNFPVKADAEEPLALLADGSVVDATGGRGEYEAPEGSILAGTPDLMFLEGEVAWGGDLKFGEFAKDHVRPVRQNLQVLGAAFFAARRLKRQSAMPFILFGDATWEYPQTTFGDPAPLDAGALAAVEQRFRDLDARVKRSLALVQAGERPELVTGAHCRWCRARLSCPAQTEEVQRLVLSASSPLDRPISRETMVQIAGVYARWDSAGKQLRALLEAWYEEHPKQSLTLPDGSVWGPRPETRETFKTRTTYEALFDALAVILGEVRAGALADAAFKTSKSALYDALSAAMDETRLRGKGKRMDALLDEIRRLGGVDTNVGERWGVYWPKPALPAVACTCVGEHVEGCPERKAA